jgi:hypothetical protein
LRWNISNIPLSHGRSTSDWIVSWTDQFWLHNSCRNAPEQGLFAQQ